MRKGTVAFQIGKNGLTDNFIATLKPAFKNRKVLKIQVLASATDERTAIRALADALVVRLGGNYKYTIIGFTIVLRRVSRENLD